MPKNALNWYSLKSQLIPGYGCPNCSVRQVVKNVRGTDTLVAAQVKALSLEDYSPVQVEKDTLADGSPGKGLRYFYELRTPPDPE